MAKDDRRVKLISFEAMINFSHKTAFLLEITFRVINMVQELIKNDIWFVVMSLDVIGCDWEPNQRRVLCGASLVLRHFIPNINHNSRNKSVFSHTYCHWVSKLGPRTARQWWAREGPTNRHDSEPSWVMAFNLRRGQMRHSLRGESLEDMWLHKHQIDGRVGSDHLCNQMINHSLSTTV